MYATKVSEGVYLLDTVALGQENTVGVYVIKAEKTALVDCGYASSYQNVLLGLNEIGVAPTDVRYLIPTHVHLDHAGAAGHLMRSMPNAQLLVHEKGAPHLVDPTRLLESATKVFGEATMELYGRPAPVPAERVIPVGKEMHVDLGGGTTATLIHTPGHAPHQISVLLERGNMLMTADAVGIVYPGLNTLIPTTPPPSFDPGALVGTVGQLEQTTPRKLLVPHFGTRDDPGRVLGDTRAKVLQWVREVGDMRNKGLALEQASDVMAAKVMEEAGVGDMPVYAKVSVRTSVMGIMHYLEKNA
ncbi:MAG TPA: MBL fold metallo-hydrolase [Nitrososphaerales archaeon]|nr:MBL fold metallo-hydrolase [Nitrososphaerales archaeon]